MTDVGKLLTDEQMAEYAQVCERQKLGERLPRLEGAFWVSVALIAGLGVLIVVSGI